jgi:hypothetical protein
MPLSANGPQTYPQQLWTRKYCPYNALILAENMWARYITALVCISKITRENVMCSL